MVILKKKIDGVTQRGLARFVMRACRAAGLSGNVNVLVTSSEELRRLNRQFRRKDKPTDVLSFPPAINSAGGDIAISGEIARKNGEALGHGVGSELKILVLHGVLHLAGFDHESDDGEMSKKERHLRRQLGLPDGLIERSLQQKTARKRMPGKRAAVNRTSKRSRKR